MDKATFRKLRDILRPQLKQHGRNHLSVGEQLFVALFSMAHGGTLIAAALACDVSMSTVSRCIARVAKALCAMQDEYITWPTGAAAEQQVSCLHREAS